MGDLSDMNDLDRFIRSPEGQTYLEEIRRTLLERRIVGVEFSNEVCLICVVFLLNDGSTFECTRPELEVDMLREDFAVVIAREFAADYPNTKKTEANANPF